MFSSLCISKVAKLAKNPDSTVTLKEKNALKKAKRKEIWARSCKHRKHLTFGLQQAIRCLEKNELCALLVCRDVSPFMMIEPLLPLCSSKRITAAAVHNLGSTLEAALNFKSCRALGFKNEVARDKLNVFHPLFELLKNKSVALPDVFERNTEDMPKLPIIPRSESTVSSSTISAPLSQPNYSHLYIKKCDVKPLNVPDEMEFLRLATDTNVDFEQANKRKRSESEFLSENLRCKKYKGMKFKQLKAVMAKDLGKKKKK